ncbi:MAG: hypothetical protein J6K64_01890 [Clostridia bacterium]|nr:hypothetical protein [Clostridia bacterium]
MKPLLGIDLTNDKKNEQLNGSEFITAKPSEAMTRALEKALNGADEVYKKSRLPLVLRIIKWICAVAGCVIIGSFVQLLALGEVSVKNLFLNETVLLFFGVTCLVAWGFIEFLSRKKEKEAMEMDESSRTLKQLERATDALFAELKVPADAKDVDILSFFYKVKEGEIKMQQKGMQIAQYYNFNYKIFADSENFYMANLEEKYAFPLSSIRTIRTVKKHIILYTWNKEEKYNKGVYKQYKLQMSEDGEIHCNKYHIMEFKHNGEIWGIYFPEYELPSFEEITGLRAE